MQPASTSPRQFPNPLALDIEEDYHQHLLEKGNLGKKPRPNWSDENAWISLGYSARVFRSVCKSCGTQTDSLVGIFHDEKTPSGSLRSTALAANAQWPQGEKYPVHVTTSPVNLCAACLPFVGFAESF